MKTASVISYCSYHNAFIDRVVEEARKVSDEIVVVSYNKFFDGQEDTELKKDLKVDQHLVLEVDDGRPSRHHHNNQRVRGYEALKGEYDAIFFIDADEVLEGDKVKDWLTTVEPGTNHKLAHFWYYRDTCYRADSVEEGAVLISTQAINSPDMNWFGYREREDFTTRWNYMANHQNRVLGHHYSWAGTEEMLLRKVRSWGHNMDGVNWEAMVEAEFAQEFNYKCPFKPYTFTKIESYVGFTFNE